MKNILLLFFNTHGTRPWIVLGCLVLAGIAEAVGITTLLPVLQHLIGDSAGTIPFFGRLVGAFLDALNAEPSLANLLILIVSVLIVNSILKFTAMTYVCFSSTQAQAALRSRFARNLLDARWSYFTTSKVGAIVNSMSNDATRINDAYITAGNFIAYCIQSVVYLGIAMLVSWKLTLVGLALSGTLAVFMNGLTDVSRRAGNKQTDRTSQLTAYIADALNNIKPIRTMNRNKPFVEHFRRKLFSLRRALRLRAVAREGMVYGREFAHVFAAGCAGYFAIVHWQMPLSEMLVMGAVFFQVITMIGKVQANMQVAAELESAYWRFHEALDASAAAVEPKFGTLKPSMENGCRFDAVSFSHSDRPTLTNVDLFIPAGGITVLQGPSGAGKTTLIDLLTGFFRPDGGRILLDGTPLEEIDIDAWRRCIGYVPQELNLLHDTIYMNITMGDADISEEDVERALSLAGARDFVAALPDGVHTQVGERGIRFSGGERQRISLARALAVNPTLLILDEATSALDPDTERAICENIKALAGNLTIVAIAHKPLWAEIATQVYTLAKHAPGRLGSATPEPAEASA